MPRRNNIIWGVLGVLLIVLLCLGSIYLFNFVTPYWERFFSDEPVACSTCTTDEPEVIFVDGALFGYSLDTKITTICGSLNSLVVDPSTIPYPVGDRELNPAVSETFEGPGIIEWWVGGTIEGVWQIQADQSMTLPAGTAGHWFPLSSNADMQAAWPLHVCNYGSKPQHVAKTIYKDLVLNPILILGLK